MPPRTAIDVPRGGVRVVRDALPAGRRERLGGGGRRVGHGVRREPRGGGRRGRGGLGRRQRRHAHCTMAAVRAAERVLALLGEFSRVPRRRPQHRSAAPRLPSRYESPRERSRAFLCSSHRHPVCRGPPARDRTGSSALAAQPARAGTSALASSKGAPPPPVSAPLPGARTLRRAPRRARPLALEWCLAGRVTPWAVGGGGQRAPAPPPPRTLSRCHRWRRRRTPLFPNERKK